MAPLRWDARHRATSRMERIILEATGETPSPTIARAVEGTGGDGSVPVAWIAASVVLAALLAGLGVARRSSAPSPKGRRRVEAANVTGRDRG